MKPMKDAHMNYHSVQCSVLVLSWGRRHTNLQRRKNEIIVQASELRQQWMATARLSKELGEGV